MRSNFSSSVHLTIQIEQVLLGIASSQIILRNLTQIANHERFVVNYMADETEVAHTEEAHTEADARAKMLIYPNLIVK